MADGRIPHVESEFAAYLQETRTHLSSPFRPAIIQGVAANTTVNLVADDYLPPQMKITLANTGAAGAPDLHFCMGNTNDEACVVGTAITVAQGVSETVTVEQLGGSAKNNLNVTNVHATDASSCQVTFQANWERLGLLPAEKQEWDNRGQMWQQKYLLTLNDNTSTKLLVTQKKQLKADFNVFAKPLLKRIDGSVNVVQEDRNTFNIQLPDSERTPREIIADAPYVDLKSGDGCTVKFTCRMVNDGSTRPRRHPAADTVEVRLVLVDINATPPANADACPITRSSKKAVFTLSLGTENAGKRMFAFVRWANTSEPHKSSPWTQWMTIVLSD